MENPLVSCPACHSENTILDGADNIVCASCDRAIRAATDAEVEEWAAYLDEQDEADAELAADRILERQELEDFEGREFYEDSCDPYDCEYDRGDEGEDYSHEGCCDE